MIRNDSDDDHDNIFVLVRLLTVVEVDLKNTTNINFSNLVPFCLLIAFMRSFHRCTAKYAKYSRMIMIIQCLSAFTCVSI